MKIPATPPDWREMFTSMDIEQFVAASRAAGSLAGYPHWDKVRRLKFPDGLTPEFVWAALAAGRYPNRRPLPLQQKDGRPFSYVLPDELLQRLERVNAEASGHLDVASVVTTPETRDRFIVRSLMEEAITSSQLEGAATTRRVAKEMLQNQRAPVTRDERMILNNYEAMRWVRAHRLDDITPESILELHGIVSRGTLEDEGQEGRIQEPGEQRIHVGAADRDLVLHAPPLAEELPGRLQRLCDFANARDGIWMPKVLRAIFCHFMMGYDHYFVDGNGRTARALFYWVALKEGAWLLEYIPISRILKDAPAKYAYSYLHCETDEGDLTYFAMYQAEVLNRGLDDLSVYLARKIEEDARIRHALPAMSLNHRERAVVEGILKNDGLVITAKSHAASHAVTVQTARADLRHLTEMGILRAGQRRGRQETWIAGPGLPELRRAAPQL